MMISKNPLLQPYFQYYVQKHIQSHIPNNYKVINKNKMSCNTLSPYISSVWEQYSKILHNMHFDHVV